MGADFSDARPGTGKIQIAFRIHSDPGGTRNARVDGERSVAAVRRGARSGDRIIGNIDITRVIERDVDRLSQQPKLGLTTVAAIARNVRTSNYGDGPVCCVDLVDVAAPVTHADVAIQDDSHTCRIMKNATEAAAPTGDCRDCVLLCKQRNTGDEQDCATTDHYGIVTQSWPAEAT